MDQKLSVSLRRRSFYIDYKSGHNARNIMKTHHLHDDYEIFYLLEGERIYLINDKRYVVQENSLVFIDKNVVHKTLVTDKPEYKRIVINFRDTFLPDDDQFLLKQLFGKGPYIIPIPINKKRVIHQLVSMLHQEYMIERNDAIIYIRSLLTQLLLESTRLLEKQHSNPVIGNKNKNESKRDIAKVIEFINTNYSKDISLCLLSQQFHLNEQYISRLFRKVTGSTIIDYLNAVRVNEAKRLLLESDMKVIEISKKVGYSNNVHLWRVFKKLTGFSPNEFRTVNLES